MTIKQAERRLAVITSWSLFGAFGIGLVQSGLAQGDVVLGLLGIGLIVIGFVAQIIINHFFGGGFSRGEIAFGITLFGISVLGFIGSWLADPDFDGIDVVIGICAFAAIIASFVVYLVTKYGMKGAFSMFHHTGH